MRAWTMTSVDRADDTTIEWYANEILPQAVASPTVSRAWLLETVNFHEQEGSTLPQLMAVFDSEGGEVLGASSYLSPEVWERSPGEFSGARSCVRPLLSDFWTSKPRGDWWCSIRIDSNQSELSLKRWQEFEDWYTYEHVGETVAAPGINEGWRLGEEREASSPPKFHDHFRWAMYELSHPTDMMRHVNKAPLRQIWWDHIEPATFARTYQKVVARV